MNSRFATFAISVLFASAAAPALALAPTGAGALDPTFGTNGVVVTNPSTAADQTWGNALQPDGKLVIAANPQVNGQYAFSLVRYLDNGALDPSFGVAGIAVYPTAGTDGPGIFSVGFDGAGRIFVAGYSKATSVFGCAVWAVLPNGQLDTTWGAGGVARFKLHAGVPLFCQSLAVQADGKVVAVGYEDKNPPAAFALRLLANGQPDATFNGQGYIELASPSGFYTEGVVIGADGSIYIAGLNNASQRSGIVVKLRPDGTPDPAFATGGRFDSSLSGGTGTEFYGIALHADGRVVVAGSRDGNLTAARLTAAGAPDPSFGTGGYSVFNVPTGTGGFARNIAIQRDGKYVVEARAVLPGSTVRFGVVRLTPAGALDPSFGTGGSTVVPAIGTGNDYVSGMALGPDGKIWLSGIPNFADNDQAYAVVRILGDEITTPVVEFHNTTLDHYFITADPNEAAAVDGGAAGPGWSRTGLTFKSGGPSKACRFYGNPDTNPATGLRRGPNSHFYTIDPAECAQVKLDSGWRFESHDFNAWPKAAGACPAGTVAVMRVYNNRFAQNDSNHRYTTSAQIYAQMVAAGWSGEGTVFCSAQ